MTVIKVESLRPRPTFIIITICSILFLSIVAATATGDPIDDGLPEDASLAIKASTRRATQNGLEIQSVITLTQAMLQHNFDEKQIQSVHTLLVETKTSGIPEGPLMNKALEGIAKNVPPSMIINAMQAVQTRNLFAYKHAEMFAEQPGQQQVLGQLLTASLTAGLSIKDASKIIGELRQHDDSRKSEMSYKLALESFQTARDVSRLGVSSQAVTGIVAQALSKGYSYEDMQSLRNTFMMKSRHTEPQEVAHAFTEAIQAGKGPQNDARSPGSPPGDSGQGSPGSGSGGSGGGTGGSGGGSGGNGESGGGSGGNGESGGGSGSGSGGGNGSGSSGGTGGSN